MKKYQLILLLISSINLFGMNTDKLIQCMPLSDNGSIVVGNDENIVFLLQRETLEKVFPKRDLFLAVFWGMIKLDNLPALQKLFYKMSWHKNKLTTLCFINKNGDKSRPLIQYDARYERPEIIFDQEKIEKNLSYY
ncbi:MAG: hypothetical protein WDZ41_04120 [Candidatus Babeliales bacterium]